jgi:lipopolysaccharide/colanic/teichoic acid biosynthesis glycosyltransferase
MNTPLTMNMPSEQRSDFRQHQVESALAERTLLYVGPAGVFPEEQTRARGLELKSVDSYIQARHWLEKASRSTLPYAIVCELDWSRSGDFALTELILRHPALRRVPFILISPEGKPFDPRLAMEMGVDDVYRTPFVWEDVFQRIDFLRSFKQELLLGNPASESRFDHRIPTSKRLFDIAVAGTLLLLISPVLLLIALGIRLESKGPIFYISKRAGSGYDVFNFYKFRSMRVGADAELKDLKHLNQYAEGEEEDAAFIKIENDPRITRLGKIIRNTSLDELPQLFNVLKGDMSIVGNRPLPLYEAEMLTKDGSAGRFLAPAGITGLWQVTKRGGNDMSISERIALDIEYARNYSLLYDFKIILKTVPALLQQSSV